MSFSHKDQILWPVYIIIRNLDTKTWQSQQWLEILFLGYIFIIYEQSKDINNENIYLKAKSYYMVLKSIL